MNILIATDKFKDSLSARAVCEGLKKGIVQTFPSANCTVLPLADGGEGTLDVLQSVLGGIFISCKVHDPLSRKIYADYLWIENTLTAVIEMARASGIELLHKNERNCLNTNTLGTGELIHDALEKGAKHIVLTIGGSATNDAGIGMASALGYVFIGENDQVLAPIGKNLVKVQTIKTENRHPKIAETKFIVATDVINPFFGKNGAAHVFAPQKGANDEAVELLDSGLKNMALVCQKHFAKDVQSYQGSGAGGGIGGGAVCFLDAQILSAADWILEVNQVADKLQNVDILITGEGKIDNQTWQGKLISRLIALSDSVETPVILVCGTMQNIESIVAQKGVIYATSILNQPYTLEEALVKSSELVENQGLLLGKLLHKFKL